eukprot:11548493-Alexandrium_andersonii.AAC.1
MPKTALVPYAGMLEGLLVTGAYASGLGSERKRKCAIPQGCPMSMATMALLMAPWVRMMRQEAWGTVLRVLADNIIILVGACSELSPQ